MINESTRSLEVFNVQAEVQEAGRCARRGSGVYLARPHSRGFDKLSVSVTNRVWCLSFLFWCMLT